MNWERSKSILIVFFLLINICLCVILVRIRTSHSTLSKNTIQQVVKLLEQNQITIREDIIPPQKYKNINFHLTTLLFEKEKNLEKWLGRGYQLSESDSAAYQYVYCNQNKQLIINKTGIEFSVNKNAVLLQAQKQKEIESNFVTKLKKLGFSEKTYYFSSVRFENGLYHATISPMCENIKIVGIQLDLTADKEEIIKISGNWFEYSGKESFTEDGLLDVTAVLTNLIYTQGKSGKEIIEVSPAAYVSKDYLDNKIVTATPIYVFTCSDGTEYCFDARSGEQLI